VASATLTPTSLLMAGQYYVAALDPSGTAPITDPVGHPAAGMTKSFRAQQGLEEGSPVVGQAWGDIRDAAALGGSYSSADRPTASATYSFSGPTVSWDTITGPGQGAADVYIDGKLKNSPDQSAATTSYGVRRTYTYLGAGSHTIRIVVRGTGAVAIDGFDVGTTTDASPALSARWQIAAASAASSGNYVQDDVAGATVSLTFRGKRIDWYTVNRPQGGQADVSIDGTSVGRVDTYSASTVYGVLQSYTVPDGVHTITITALGRSQSAATGSLVAVDRFVVG
jgi:hypothetical protein